MKTQVHESVKTWETGLATGKLTEEQWKALRDLVEVGEVETLEEAAQLLDFRERERDLDDTLYGV